MTPVSTSDEMNNEEVRPQPLVESSHDNPSDVPECNSDDVIIEPVITDEMVKYEEILHQKTETENERWVQKRMETWTEIGKIEREDGYRKLNSLLYRSNRYAQYIVSRIHQQRIDNVSSATKDFIVFEENCTDWNIKDNEKAEPRKPFAEYQEQEPQHSVTDNIPDVSDGIEVSSDQRQTNSSCNSNENNTSANNKKGLKRKQLRHSSTSRVNKKAKLLKVDEKGDDNEEDTSDKENIQPSSPEHSTRLDYESSYSPDEVRRYIDGQLVHRDQPQLFSGGVLRSYQMVGLKWLTVLYMNAINGILADEMGLGKTAQSIAMICYLVEQKVRGPFLICAPLSTLHNWISEMNRFAPKLPVVLYHGSKTERDVVKKHIFRSHNLGDGFITQPVVVTSYEIALREFCVLRMHSWSLLIVDEGQRIKNKNCRLIRQLRMYNTSRRLILTGTPLQNNLCELWTLLNFLIPELFDDLGSFQSWFEIDYMTNRDDEDIVEKAKHQNVLDMLHQILSPFMLRRLKCDVERQLPPKKEAMVYAPLTEVQCQYYHSFLEQSQRKKSEDDVTKGAPPETIPLDAKGRPVRRASSGNPNYKIMMENSGGSSNEDKDDEEDILQWFSDVTETKTSKGKNCETATREKSDVDRSMSLMNVLMQLRKTCNHPYLLEYPLTDDGNYKIDEDLVTCGGKMMILDRMLSQLYRDKHKVLIFSQMTKMLDILHDYCYLRSYPFCRIDGSTKIADRQEQITEFNSDDKMFIFLLSTRAGGLGINLTAADTVIVYDSDWNPQIDLQAEDRCHRIGQTRPVVVYRLVASGTVDQHIVERAVAKRKLERMVIHRGKFCTGFWDKDSAIKKSVTREELLSLLQLTSKSKIGKSHKAVMKDEELKKLLDRSDLYAEWEKTVTESNKSLESN